MMDTQTILIFILTSVVGFILLNYLNNRGGNNGTGHAC